jgi:hypothetical protein
MRSKIYERPFSLRLPHAARELLEQMAAADATTVSETIRRLVLAGLKAL